MCCACCISECRKERPAEKCRSPVDAGFPATSSFFRTKSIVTILIQFPENASIHLSMQPSSNPPFSNSFFLLPMPSSVQAFIYPSFSLQFIVTSSLCLSSLRSDIRLSAYRLSICLSTHPAVRPFSHFVIQPSVHFHFSYPSIYTFLFYPNICSHNFVCLAHSASTLLFTQFSHPSFILESTFHIFSLYVHSPFSYPSIYLLLYLPLPPYTHLFTHLSIYPSFTLQSISPLFFLPSTPPFTHPLTIRSIVLLFSQSAAF